MAGISVLPDTWPHILTLACLRSCERKVPCPLTLTWPLLPQVCKELLKAETVHGPYASELAEMGFETGLASQGHLDLGCR